jgi:hypothetical protein
MTAPSQLYSIPSLQASSVFLFLIISKSFTHTDILFWDARGIKSKKYEFLNYLEVNSIPVTLISETHLQPSMKFKCQNYFIYRTDRLNHFGGRTAILIREDIIQNQILLPHLQPMEAIAIHTY